MLADMALCIHFFGLPPFELSNKRSSLGLAVFESRDSGCIFTPDLFGSVKMNPGVFARFAFVCAGVKTVNLVHAKQLDRDQHFLSSSFEA